jgi:ketosteroid isomerase-like protein
MTMQLIETVHPNEKAFREALAAFNSGDYEGASLYFSEDVVWHYPCRNPLQGVYYGRQGLIDFFTGLYELSQGAVKADTLWILADDEHVVRAARIWFERDGNVVEWMGASVCNVGPDGLVTEAWIYEDDVEVSKLFGHAE